MALHILPLLMADHPVLDDYARQQLARNDWADVGRPLMVVVFAALSFASGAINLYPLPLLLAVLVTALALTRLVRQWFTQPTLSSVLVVLPLWFQPYFLQNLSYQYDSATMALSLAAVIWAVTTDTGCWRHWLGGMLLIAAAAALYQPSVNVFVGLCALEVIRRAIEDGRAGELYRHAAIRFGQLLVAVALYYVSSAWMVTSARSSMLALDGQWLTEIQLRLRATFQVVGLLITPGNAWLFVALLPCALLVLLRELSRVWQPPLGAGERLARMAIVLISVAVIVLCVPGFILLLEHFEQTVRVLMGLGVLLTLLLYLNHRALARWPRLRVLALAVPLLFMLSFSFAYGRVMVLQKVLHQANAQALAQDLSRPPLNGARHYYVLDFWLKRPWIPAAAGTLQRMPAMAVIHAYHYVVLPEMLPRVGIDDLHTFYQGPPLDRQQVLALSPTPQVSSRLYDIHRVGDDVYVLVKAPEGYGQ
ncbi:glucosyltransferase domain-containing protein [Pseudomonas sp. NPDC089996]|uniref:glucosyltransferase domain-containing protein n=1 Tax=Pseudomonas sp. NPDC089996 TaxID=3364474 RepID=UPI0037F5A12B